MTSGPTGQGPAPGWYSDPQGPGQRYWDGTQWTEHRAPAAPGPPPPQATPRKKRGGTVWKVMLGVVLGGCVLIVGCAALLGGAANEADKSLKRDQNKHAITNDQARGIPLGTTRGEVESQFGTPKDTQESENSGVGSDTCIYYNIKGGQLLDQWQFCFDGQGAAGKLTTKNRL